jgi:hypothetical protein
MRTVQNEKKAILKSGFGLQDVLLLMALQQRTGELILESGNNIGTLVFYRGKLLLAFSPYTRAIGDLLVERGALTDAELLDVLKQQRTGPHTPVGTLLLKTGKVTFRDIELLVQDQIRNAIKDFGTWDNLDLSFVNKEITPFDTISLSVHEFIPEEMRKATQYCATNMPS